MQIIGDQCNQDVLGPRQDGEPEHLRRILTALPESVRSVTEHSDAFWKRQQSEICKRIATSRPGLARATWAWASVLALGALMMLYPNGRSAPSPSRAENDSDQELFVAVEQAVQSDVTEALSPAALLADEIIGNAQPISTSSRVYKENQNENQ